MAAMAAGRDDSTPLLSIGMVRAGGSAIMRFVIDDLHDLMQLVGRQAEQESNEGLRLNIIFGVPGPVDKPPHQGVVPGRFYSKRDLLIVGAAVPDDLSPRDTTHYIRDTFEAALAVADERMRQKKVELDSSAVRAFAKRIGQMLPERPLDGTERFGEELLEAPSEGPVRAYS